ncbi:MAG: DUF4230 domain-containing protein [Prevotella sp.]|jgi:hypothetical protein|nr:DUF4230 domain-containing protein [Prevotella sp.]
MVRKINLKQKSNLSILLVGILIGVVIMVLLRRGENTESKIQVSHTMIVEKIESLGNLEVLKYNIQDIVEYEKIRQWLPNAKTALVVSGEIICCVDLTKIKPEDIYTSGDSLRLQLPAPEVCHTKIDHSKSRVYNIQYGLWETTKIVDEAYRSAERQLQERAMELDMETKSRDNTVNLLTPIFQAMGFEHVFITFENRVKIEKH